MDFSEYQSQARRTQNKDLTPREMQEHALCGLASEVGEVLGIFQKIYQGKNFSMSDLKKEMGDVLWMIAELCDVYGIDLEEVAWLNIEKLKRRYPDGFDADRSNRRYEHA